MQQQERANDRREKLHTDKKSKRTRDNETPSILPPPFFKPTQKQQTKINTGKVHPVSIKTRHTKVNQTDVLRLQHIKQNAQLTITNPAKRESLHSFQHPNPTLSDNELLPYLQPQSHMKPDHTKPFPIPSPILQLNHTTEPTLTFPALPTQSPKSITKLGDCSGTAFMTTTLSIQTTKDWRRL